MRFGILASGSGTNAKAIIEKVHNGVIDASIELVASNRSDARVLERAGELNVPTCVLEPSEFPDREAYDSALADILIAHNCDAVILAGYMLLLSDRFLEAFNGNVLNIHPALLPSFPGLHGARDAFEYGVKISGPTVHFVEKEMDSGPIIIQAAVPVKADESPEELQARIHNLEHRIYPQAVQWFAQGRLKVEGRIVKLRECGLQKVMPSVDCLVWPPLEEGF